MPEAPYDPTDPNDPTHGQLNDPLRAAFHRAGAHGQAGADPAPLGEVAVRGDRLRRRRALAQVAAAVVFLAGTGVAVAALAPGDHDTPPAAPPSVSDATLPTSGGSSAFPSPVPTTDAPGSATTSSTVAPTGTTAGTTTAPGGIPTSENR